MQRQETWIESECVGCGVTFQQRDDAGRKREYHSRACRQAAYRARTGRDGHESRRAAGERQRRSQQDERQRMYEEAFAREEERKQRERERSQRRRGREHVPDGVPSWCFTKAGEPTGKAKQRARAYKLYVRYLSPVGDDDHEGEAAREAAERIRAEARL